MGNHTLKDLKGTLSKDAAGFVILKTEEGVLYPLCHAMFVALPIEAMKVDSIRAFNEYIDQSVTISGYPEGDLIYDARVIRTYVPKDSTAQFGEEYWNNRVPSADITFKARKLPGHSTLFAVDVRQMITINDSVIRKDLEEHGLMVNDPANCDGDIYRIYRHSRIKQINPYLYEYDNQIFGCEFFMYPYELRVLQKGDCDDWGIELASYLISAGVPEWRVRCVVGTTFGGGGHLTVYVLSDELTNWYHINSTTSWQSVEQSGIGRLTDFPKAGDSNDNIGIEDVWFSFNNKYAWHTFETHASAGNAEKIGWMRHFKIKPRF